MRKLHKAVMASALALAVSAGTIAIAPAPVEAGFGLGGAIGGALGGSGKVDVDGLTNRQNGLLTNLVRSVQCMAVAAGSMNNALGLGIATQDTEAANAAADSAISSGDAGEMLNFAKSDTLMSSYADKNVREQMAKDGAAKLKEKLSAGNEEELKELDASIKTAKLARLTSDIFVGAAAMDAVKIIKDAGDGVKSGGDMATQCQQILDTTKAAKTCLDVRGGVSKMLGTLSKEYEKTRKIEVSKDEVKANQEAISKG